MKNITPYGQKIRVENIIKEYFKLEKVKKAINTANSNQIDSFSDELASKILKAIESQ